MVSVTITNPGSGYLPATPPAVSFTSAAGSAVTVGTIGAVAGGQVTTLTPTAGTPFPNVPAGTYPATVPLTKTQATASATVVGGVITGLTLTNQGAGYATAPVVTFGAPGTGAAAHTTVLDGRVATIVLDAGGSGYVLSGGPIINNPNKETFAVQVFDEYGNALEGYKVTWEVVGQGETTAGTIPTYHPYAHFENPKYDDPITGA